MEKNIVVLDIKEYNELRDIRDKVLNGEKICMYFGYDQRNLTFLTQNEALVEIEKNNKQFEHLHKRILDDKRLLSNQNRELEKEIDKLKSEIHGLNTELTITNIFLNSIEKYNIFQFINWKKEYAKKIKTNLKK